MVQCIFNAIGIEMINELEDLTAKEPLHLAILDVESPHQLHHTQKSRALYQRDTGLVTEMNGTLES